MTYDVTKLSMFKDTIAKQKKKITIIQKDMY